MQLVTSCTIPAAKTAAAAHQTPAPATSSQTPDGPSAVSAYISPAAAESVPKAACHTQAEEMPGPDSACDKSPPDVESFVRERVGTPQPNTASETRDSRKRTQPRNRQLPESKTQ